VSRSLGVLLGAAVLLLMAGASARADGSLPPLPYHYLHPPAAIAGSNTPPSRGDGTILAAGGTSKSGFVFTQDGQAGLLAQAGAFKVPAGTSTIAVTVRPVDAPQGLPVDYVANGNAYEITATAKPGGQSLQPAGQVSINMHWPHIPVAMYVYRDGKYQRVCFTDQGTLSPTSLSCKARTLGIFVTLTPPSRSGIRVPTTPISQSRWAFLNKYIPLAAAVVVVLISAILAYFVTRRERRA
jgi:hypothetical protein